MAVKLEAAGARLGEVGLDWPGEVENRIKPRRCLILEF